MELNKTIPFYFRQPTLESVSIPELQKAIERYPYCVSLQYLLLKKQQTEQDPDFGKQLNKAFLYFPNAYQLQALLQEKQGTRQELLTRVPEPEKPIVRETIPEPVLKPEPEFIPEPPILSGAPVYFVEKLTAPVLEQLIPITTDENPEQEIESGPEPALRTDLLRRESPIPIPSLKDIGPQNDDLPLFEPYHTIDYFASQGIKLSHELPVNDRLGRQMRSFTDWIRTMKKLPQADLENKLDEVGMGEKIVAMAAGSVIAREVITETMAEVLVKQGNFRGAVDLYRKLSLAHPDKSAYFAARIEHLKKQQ